MSSVIAFLPGIGRPNPSGYIPPDRTTTAAMNIVGMQYVTRLSMVYCANSYYITADFTVSNEATKI